jgi:hypothetical protein
MPRSSSNKAQNTSASRLFASPIYEPSTLHKYSHEMKESKFLFFSPTTGNTTGGERGGGGGRGRGGSHHQQVASRPEIHNTSMMPSSSNRYSTDTLLSESESEVMPLNPQSYHNKDRDNSGGGSISRHSSDSDSGSIDGSLGIISGYGSTSTSMSGVSRKNHHHYSPYRPTTGTMYAADEEYAEDEVDDGLVVKPFTIDFGQ